MLGIQKKIILNTRIDTDSWFIICVCFLSVLGLLVFLYIIIPYRSRLKNKKRRRNRFKKKLNQFEHLEKIQNDVKLKDLEKLNTKLKTNLNTDLIRIKENKTDKSIETFFSNFEKLYPNFKGFLLGISPKLTSKEIQLCAFLRMNLSSKEIAELHNITPESVHKARYRLRKKLQLTKEEDLSKFILNI